jgi:hypothetical protein
MRRLLFGLLGAALVAGCAAPGGATAPVPAQTPQTPAPMTAGFPTAWQSLAPRTPNPPTRATEAPVRQAAEAPVRQAGGVAVAPAGVVIRAAVRGTETVSGRGPVFPTVVEERRPAVVVEERVPTDNVPLWRAATGRGDEPTDPGRTPPRQ